MTILLSSIVSHCYTIQCFKLWQHCTTLKFGRIKQYDGVALLHSNKVWQYYTLLRRDTIIEYYGEAQLMSVGFEVYILDYDELSVEALSQENKRRKSLLSDICCVSPSYQLCTSYRPLSYKIASFSRQNNCIVWWNYIKVGRKCSWLKTYKLA